MKRMTIPKKLQNNSYKPSLRVNPHEPPQTTASPNQSWAQSFTPTLATPPKSPSANRQKQQSAPAQMTANVFHNIAQIETSLWEAADQLRAYSNLTVTE
jgi:hypothetical protein